MFGVDLKEDELLATKKKKKLFISLSLYNVINFQFFVLGAFNKLATVQRKWISIFKKKNEEDWQLI